MSYISSKEMEEAMNRVKFSQDKIIAAQYENLRLCFKALIDAVLGEDYYNEGNDIYMCDTFSARDIARKIGYKAEKKFIENYFLLKEKGEKDATR